MIAAEACRSKDGAFSSLASGPDDGPSVVFLHGIGGGASLWARQLGAFPGFRTIAWDMPGYGSSAALAEPPSIDAYARALGRFVAGLGPTAPVLVGHSIGGMIVQGHLAEALGPVRAAVLVQTTPAFGGRDPAWAESFVRARLAPLDEGAPMASLADNMVAGMVGDDPDPAGLAVARAAIAATPEPAYRASVAAMVGFDRRAALGRIAVPTLVVAGSKDTNAPAPTLAKMAAAIPGAVSICLDGVGHLAMLERPEAFNEALAAFLATLTSPPSPHATEAA